MFSPGNLRATFDNAAYEKLISYYVGEKYTLRYTGGMVPGRLPALAIALASQPLHPASHSHDSAVRCLA